MKRLELTHKNQCDGLIPDGSILYTLIESNGLLHDIYINRTHIAQIRGNIKGNKIILEDTTE